MERARRIVGGVLALSLGLVGCSLLHRAPPPPPPPPSVSAPTPPPRHTGTASWYGADFHGRRTASGERFNQHELTAAHRSLPLGTRVRVTNVANGRSAIVRINDRGPFVRGRMLDLSRAAARQLGMLGHGTARVQLEVVERPSE